MNNLTRRNFILGSLGVASVLGIAGCGNASTNQGSDAQETTEETQGESPKYAVRETVETDLVKFTLNNACFTIALENSYPKGCDFNDNTAYGTDYQSVKYFTPKEYSAEEGSKNPYVAPKGCILVYTEMTFENLDRTYLEVDESFNKDFATLHYKDSDYTIGNNNGDSYAGDNKRYGIEADPEGKWEGVNVSNLILPATSTEIYRAYYCYPVEPDSLDEPFELTFQLPNSSGETESFIFSINQ